MNEIIYKFESGSLELTTEQNVAKFTGYMTTTERDRDGHKIMRKALEDWSKKHSDLPLLWAHDKGAPIGKFSNIKLDSKGLYGEGTIHLTLQKGAEAKKLYDLDLVKGLSIGFRPNFERITFSDNTIEFHEVDIREVSMVMDPSNQSAQIEMLKSKLNGENRMSGDGKTNQNKNGESGTYTKAEVDRLIDEAKEEAEIKATKQIEMIRKHQPREVDVLRNPVFEKSDWQVDGAGEKRKSYDVFGLRGTDRRAFRKDVREVQKSIDPNEGIPGSEVSSLGVWRKPNHMPIFRELAMISNTVDGDSFKTTQLSGVEITGRASEANPRANYGGSASSSSHQVEMREGTCRYSDASGDDLANLEAEAVMELIEKHDSDINQRFLDLLVASVNSAEAGSATAIKTGASGKLSTAVQIVGHLKSLLDSVPARYRDENCRFLLSTDTYGLLLESVSPSGEWAKRPVEDMKLYGFEIIPSDQLSSDKTDGTVKAIFASIQKCCLIGVRQGIEVTRYAQTMPGSVILIGRERRKEVLLDPTGIAGLVVGA